MMESRLTPALSVGEEGMQRAPLRSGALCWGEVDTMGKNAMDRNGREWTDAAAAP